MQISELPARIAKLLMAELNTRAKQTAKLSLDEFNWNEFSQGYAFWYKINQGIFDDVPLDTDVEIVITKPNPPVTGSLNFKVKPLQVKSNDLVDKIKAIGVINITAMEQKLAIPKGSVAKAINGSRLIPNKYIFTISQFLSKF